MKNLSHSIFLLFFILINGLSQAHSQQKSVSEPTAFYLLAGAPAFDMTIAQFRKLYNASNPALYIGEYRAISDPGDKHYLVRAASKISNNLYSSAALERGTGKIKTVQMTWLIAEGPEHKASYNEALDYMAALMRVFEPMLSVKQSIQRVSVLLAKGRGHHYYSRNEGALRYVVADGGESGLTFAIEPLKLALLQSEK